VGEHQYYLRLKLNLEDQGVENTERNAVVQALRVKPVDTAVDALVTAPAVANVQPVLVTRVQNTVVLISVVDADAVVNSTYYDITILRYYAFYNYHPIWLL
jgi:hypothetical protein